MAEDADRAQVAELLGRPPQGAFDVVVRHPDGSPVVIRNSPFLDDGEPMPTLYWLVGDPEQRLVGTLESDGGVKRAESEVDAFALIDAHANYAAERSALVPSAHPAPWPTGGVGGSRAGVKCLHAHYAYWLTGAPDPVGNWVAERLGRERPATVPPRDSDTTE